MALRLWLTNSTVRPTRGLAHLSQAFLLELGVADGQDLVDEQDLGLQVRGDGEGQAHIHARGITLDWRVEEFSTSAKATIASNFRRISARVMPRIAPFR